MNEQSPNARYRSEGSLDEERRRRRRRLIDEALDDIVRQVEESDELRHLYGKPLDLGDDNEEWMANHILKNAGYTHPILQRRHDLQTARQTVERIVDRLQERHDWLTRPDATITPEAADAFNTARRQILEEYRDGLAQLNKKIRDYNLIAPDVMHELPLRPDQLVALAAERVPAGEPTPPPPRPRSWFSRLFRRP